jgi:hypothetical protein
MGGGFRGGMGGGFRGGMGGGFRGGFGGFRHGFNQRFIGNRFFAGNRFFNRGFFGFGGSFVYPAYGLGFSYGPSYADYPYSDSYAAYPAYQSSPNVTVIYPEQPQAVPAVVYVQPAEPVIRDYDQASNQSSGDDSPIYLIAFKDPVIRAAIAYWVELVALWRWSRPPGRSSSIFPVMGGAGGSRQHLLALLRAGGYQEGFSKRLTPIPVLRHHGERGRRVRPLPSVVSLPVHQATTGQRP